MENNKNELENGTNMINENKSTEPVNQESKPNKQEEKEKKGNKKWVALGIIIGIIIIILLLLRSCGSKESEIIEIDNKPGFSLEYDDNQTDEKKKEKTQEEIQAELNEKVRQGMINISMNLNPKFENGKAEGDLLIDNSEINNYPQVVELTLEGTGELIYRSKLIKVGSRIDKAKLDVELPKGEYDCIAAFHNVDPETGESLGKAQAVVKLSILN